MSLDTIPHQDIPSALYVVGIGDGKRMMTWGELIRAIECRNRNDEAVLRIQCVRSTNGRHTAMITRGTLCAISTDSTDTTALARSALHIFTRVDTSLIVR